MKRWILLVGLGCLLAAAAGLLVRRSNVTVVHMGRGNVYPCGLYRPEVRFAKIPNCSGMGRVGSSEAFFSYNSLGHRDREYPDPPAPGTTRVLMLDGSVLAGSGLDEKLSPVRLIEGELRAKGRRVEVVNASVEGFSTVENAIKLPPYLGAYEPQVVILYSISNFKMFNDLVMNEYLKRDEDGYPLELWSPISAFPLLRLRAVVQPLFNTFEAWERLKVARALGALPEAEQRARLISVTLDTIERMRDRAARRGARFYLLWDGLDATTDLFLQPLHSEGLFRLLGSFVPKLSVPASELEAEFARRGIPVISIAQEYKREMNASHVFPNDHHWNEAGSRAFARMAAAKILPVLEAKKKPR